MEMGFRQYHVIVFASVTEWQLI